MRLGLANPTLITTLISEFNQHGKSAIEDSKDDARFKDASSNNAHVHVVQLMRYFLHNAQRLLCQTTYFHAHVCRAMISA